MSTSWLRLGSIAASLADGVVPAASIVSVLTSSGLALVEPRVAGSWSLKTQRLVFKGLRTSVFSLFWVMACGVSTVSLGMLAVASGIVIPMIIGWFHGLRIKERAGEYWSSRIISVE